MKTTSGVKAITTAAIIAALYTVLTFLSAMLGISSGVIQFRLSEILCILPVFTASAIPGLFLGCLISNLLTGAVIWDVIFGSIATLLAALGTYAFKNHKYIAAAFPVISNAAIVPFVLRYAYGCPDSIPFMVATVAIGEIVTAYIGGLVFHRILSTRCRYLFR